MTLSRNGLDDNYSGLGLYVKLDEKCFVSMQDTCLLFPLNQCAGNGAFISAGPFCFPECVTGEGNKGNLSECYVA